MRVQPRQFLMVTLSLLGGCSREAAPPLGSDSAKELLERDWNAGFPTQLGRVEFVSDPRDAGQNRLSAAVIPVYRVLGAKGYLALSGENRRSLDWGSVAQQTQRGSRAAAIVSATPAGRNATALSKLDGTNARERRFRALLRFDPQALRWAVVAIDLTGRTQDFTTRRVPHALQVVARQAKSSGG